MRGNWIIVTAVVPISEGRKNTDKSN